MMIQIGTNTKRTIIDHIMIKDIAMEILTSFTAFIISTNVSASFCILMRSCPIFLSLVLFMIMGDVFRSSLMFLYFGLIGFFIFSWASNTCCRVMTCCLESLLMQSASVVATIHSIDWLKKSTQAMVVLTSGRASSHSPMVMISGSAISHPDVMVI